MPRHIDAEKTYEVIKNLLYETAINNAGVNEAVDVICQDFAENRLATWLDEVPSVELSEGVKWIPVSERLPEEETDVLVTRTFLGCKDGSHGWNSHIPPKTYVEVAQYFNGEWMALSDEYKVARNRHTDPVAWAPMPEPYKEEKK